MSREIVVVASCKGGVGKSSATANIGAALVGLGMRVLLVDSDHQASLSSYYELTEISEGGFFEMVSSADQAGFDPSKYISKTVLDGLDLVYNNDAGDVKIKTWLNQSSSRLHYLSLALSKIEHLYDYILIDTIGTASPYSAQEMALRSATFCISPTTAEWLSAEVFSKTIDMFNSIEIPSFGKNTGFTLPPVKVVMWKIDNTKDNQMVSQQFLKRDSAAFLSYLDKARFKLDVMNTIVPARAAFNGAKGSGMPVHLYEPKRNQGKAASEIMLELVHELFAATKPFDFDNPYISSKK